MYRRPADADLARFVGEAVLLPGMAQGGSVTCSLGLLPLASGMPEGTVDVLIRPEQIRLSSAAEIDARDTSAIRAWVRDVDYYGHDASIELVLQASEPPIVLTARVPGHMAPHAGDDVAVVVRGEVVTFPPGRP